MSDVRAVRTRVQSLADDVREMVEARDRLTIQNRRIEEADAKGLADCHWHALLCAAKGEFAARQRLISTVGVVRALLAGGGFAPSRLPLSRHIHEAIEAADELLEEPRDG